MKKYNIAISLIEYGDIKKNVAYLIDYIEDDLIKIKNKIGTSIDDDDFIFIFNATKAIIETLKNTYDFSLIESEGWLYD